MKGKKEGKKTGKAFLSNGTEPVAGYLNLHEWHTPDEVCIHILIQQNWLHTLAHVVDAFCLGVSGCINKMVHLCEL